MRQSIKFSSVCMFVICFKHIVPWPFISLSAKQLAIQIFSKNIWGKTTNSKLQPKSGKPSFLSLAGRQTVQAVTIHNEFINVKRFWYASNANQMHASTEFSMAQSVSFSFMYVYAFRIIDSTSTCTLYVWFSFEVHCLIHKVTNKVTMAMLLFFSLRSA